MEHTRTINREFNTGDKAVLHIEARSGTVFVESHTRDVVQVEAVVHVWSDMGTDADEAASLVARGMEQDGHRVIVRAPSLPQSEGWSIFGGKRGSRVDYNVRVPMKTAARVLSRSGRIGVARTEGRVHIESGSGRCSVEDVTGDVSIGSRSGSITVERVQGDLTIEARSGRIEVRGVRGKATVETRSGAIDIRDVGDELSAIAHTGAINIGQAAGRVYARAHTGAIRYHGKVLGDFDVKAQTGLIHLAVDADRPFFIDAESTVGSVTSELPPRRAEVSANGAGPKVRLRTHTGAIRLTRL
jgi:DUF4097 and DUF4098 domain-containing protein YvlB